MIARYLNIDDRIVTLPAISAVGFSESKIGLIYSPRSPVGKKRMEKMEHLEQL
jgi:hypothetical protein